MSLSRHRDNLFITFLISALLAVFLPTVIDIREENGSVVCSFVYTGDESFRSGSIAVSPRSVNFGYVQNGESAVREISLRNSSDATVNLAVSSSSGAVKLLCPDTLAPGERGVLAVICSPPEVGTFSAHISLYSGNDVLEIPLEAICVGDSHSEEDAPVLQAPDSPVALSRGGGSIVLKNTGRSTLTVYRIEAEGAVLSGVPSAIRPGHSSKIKIKMTEMDGRIFIFTDDPVCPCCEIRLKDQ